MGQGEIFLNEDGWKEEAIAVIKDVEKYVELILISDQLDSSCHQVHLNLTTKEKQRFTVELSAQGFRVVGLEHNTTSDPSDSIFETPYSLLDSLSPTYRESFGEDLTKQLMKLQVQRQGEEQQESADSL